MNQMYKFLIAVFLMSGAGYSNAQNINIIPYPSQVDVLKGDCVLYNAPLFTNDKELAGLLVFFNEEMGLKEKNNKTSEQVIDLKILPSANTYGSYELVTSEKKVSVTASDTAG